MWLKPNLNKLPLFFKTSQSSMFDFQQNLNPRRCSVAGRGRDRDWSATAVAAILDRARPRYTAISALISSLVARSFNSIVSALYHPRPWGTGVRYRSDQWPSVECAVPADANCGAAMPSSDPVTTEGQLTWGKLSESTRKRFFFQKPVLTIRWVVI